jgi:hypothetical protein
MTFTAWTSTLGQKFGGGRVNISSPRVISAPVPTRSSKSS